MGSTRRSYTPEYKAQSVAFVVDGGRPVAEVARNIGVHEMTLGKWVKVARDAAESGKNPDAPLGESERAELVRLRAESRDDKIEAFWLAGRLSAGHAATPAAPWPGRPGRAAWPGDRDEDRLCCCAPMPPERPLPWRAGSWPARAGRDGWRRGGMRGRG